MSSGTAFSLDAYRQVLAAGLRSGYHFTRFGDVRLDPPSPRRECLLRHDIDVSMDYALRMAEVEADAGIAATYFVMLRSPAYNLLGRFASVALRRIVALGHDVGVHFDAQHPHVGADDLVDDVLEEARIVGDLAERPVKAVSFHQPSDYVLGADISAPGLINTYNRRQLAGWHYASDSNRVWKGPTAYELLAQALHPKLQLLIHPMWWVCDAATTAAVWDQSITRNFEIMQHQFLETEGAYGRERTLTVAPCA